MHITSALRRLSLVLAVLVAAGCGSDPRKPYPVQGVIVFDNDQPAKELAGYLVTFTPTSAESLGSSVGTVEADGTFRLSCRKEGDGAVAGTHHVTISAPDPDEESDDRGKARRPRLKLLLDPATASQEATVEPKSNHLTLKVKRAAGSR